MKAKKGEVRIDPALLPTAKSYEDGVADGRLEMQAEIDEQLLVGLVTVHYDNDTLPVLLSPATMGAVARLWWKGQR